MKKVLAMLLCVAMVLSMIACGGNTNTTTAATKDNGATVATTKGDEGTTEAELTLAEQAIADRRAEYEKTGKYEVVSFCLFDWAGVLPGNDRIEAAINNLLHERLCLEIDLMFVDNTTFQTSVALMLSSGEKVDVFSVGGVGYSTCLTSGYLYDMNENNLIQNYGQGILEYVDEVYLKAGTADGKLYTVPPVKDMAATCAFVCIGQDYLDAIGYDYESKWIDPTTKEAVKGDWDEMDEIFAALHEKFPDKNVLSMIPGVNSIEFMDQVGNDSFGVLMDPVNSLELSNLYTTDEAMAVFKRARKYYELGYFSKDCLTGYTPMGLQVASGTAMSMCASGKPGYRTQVSVECSHEMIPFSFGGDFVSSSVPLSVCWGLAWSTEDPVAAMQVLNAFYSDVDLSNLLCRGEEGKDYVFTEDGRVTYPEGVDMNNAEWNHSVLWEMPNECISYVWYTDSPDIWERTLEFNKNAYKSIAMGFSWDNTDYATEYSALNNVYNEYRNIMWYGAEDPDVYVPEMEAKLEANGLFTYIDAKQEALNAWAAANGIVGK